MYIYMWRFIFWSVKLLVLTHSSFIFVTMTITRRPEVSVLAFVCTWPSFWWNDLALMNTRSLSHVVQEGTINNGDERSVPVTEMCQGVSFLCLRSWLIFVGREVGVTNTLGIYDFHFFSVLVFLYLELLCPRPGLSSSFTPGGHISP